MDAIRKDIHGEGVVAILDSVDLSGWDNVRNLYACLWGCLQSQLDHKESDLTNQAIDKSQFE